jgi:hypothetical protein
MLRLNHGSGARMREGVDNFFLWVARNPLKSPESGEGIQINPREIQARFSWFFLVWLGFGLEKFDLRRILRLHPPEITSAREQ